MTRSRVGTIKIRWPVALVNNGNSLTEQKNKAADAQGHHRMAAELRERDRRDRTRAASPLVAAEDAVVIDSTNLSEDEVLSRIEALVEQSLAARN